MENVVKYAERPELNDPVFIEGLPGVGNVGKIAADYLAEKLGAVKFADIYSKHFPPQVMPDHECVAHMACNKLYYVKNAGGRDLIFLLGDFQGLTPEGQYELADLVLSEAISFNVSKVFTLGGYGTGNVVETPRVLGAVSHAEMKKELEKHGVTFIPGEPGAGIIGASGLILGMCGVKGLDAACLMGETSGYFVDHKSSGILLRVLMSILGISVDTGELDERSQQLDEFTAKMKEIAEGQNRDSLGYFG